MGDKRHRHGEEGPPPQGHEELFELATRQHGVVSTRQLESLGYGRGSAAKAHNVGRLRRVYRGVYAVGRDVLEWRGRCMAAVLASRPAVASHLSAGYLWGMLRYRPEAMAVTTPTSRRRRPGFQVHRAHLAPADLAAVEGIPCTAPARTQLDLAALLTEEGLNGMISRTEELRIFDLQRLDETMSRYRGHPGVGRLRHALSIYRDHPAFTRSGLERRFLALVGAAGLPRPSMNFNVAGFELDAYWPEEQFAVELDVYETHGGRAAFERDRLRQEELKLIGIEMVRITGARLDREPDRVVARIEMLLERRRRELGAG